MRQYLLYSGIMHTVVLAACFLLLRPMLTHPPENSMYNIDFIGAPTAEPIATPTPDQAAAAPAAEEPKEEPQPDEPVLTRRGKKIVLAKPSILAHLKTPKPAAAQTAPSAKPTLAPADQPSGVAFASEFPNFPYPWYITQVRAALWNAWSSRMPRDSTLSCVVGFRIQKNGTVRALSAEKSSGNRLFDYAAVSSVEQALPFPPLPRDYKDRELTVHVEFKVAQ